MNDKKYSVLICGCGSIGANKPEEYDSPKTEGILTHAHAAYVHPRIDRIAFYDIDPLKAQLAAQKWRHATVFSDPAQFDAHYKAWGPDIVIVATPTETHYGYLKQILQYEPKVLIAEKPFCSNLIQAEDIAQLLKTVRTKCIVNYSRRFEPIHRLLAKNIQTGAYGEAMQCRCIYTRGLYREASHAVDLFNWFFGEFVEGSAIVPKHPRATWDDYDSHDLTKSVALCYEQCPHTYLTPADGRDYCIFEIDMLFRKVRVRLIKNGQTIEFLKPGSSIYGPYASMPDEGAKHGTSLTRSLYNLISHAIDILDGKIKPLCSVEDAIRVHRVLKSITQGGV